MEQLGKGNLLESCYEMLYSANENQILLTDQSLIDQIITNVSPNYTFNSPEVLVDQEVKGSIKINKTQEVDWSYIGSFKNNHIMLASVINRQYRYGESYINEGSFITSISRDYWLILQQFEHNV